MPTFHLLCFDTCIPFSFFRRNSVLQAKQKRDKKRTPAQLPSKSIRTYTKAKQKPVRAPRPQRSARGPALLRRAPPPPSPQRDPASPPWTVRTTHDPLRASNGTTWRCSADATGWRVGPSQNPVAREKRESERPRDKRGRSRKIRWKGNSSCSLSSPGSPIPFPSAARHRFFSSPCVSSSSSSPSPLLLLLACGCRQPLCRDRERPV